jgi:hypothetical protein
MKAGKYKFVQNHNICFTPVIFPKSKQVQKARMNKFICFELLNHVQPAANFGVSDFGTFQAATRFL